MMKKFRLLVVLLTIFFGSFSSVYRILPAVKATYVEGIIAQDTDWTLVDSPFVVSNNITINPGVTLTIEPGVDVRFGGDFSLIVYGKIVADGSNDKMIRFTSNRLTPIQGDWGTILLEGSEQSSMTHCIIEYGTNGITSDNGSLNLQDSFVRFNSENGTSINDGSVIVKNNEITNNTANGIGIAGGSQVVVEDNVISANGDGISLTGHLVGKIDIQRNKILFNKQSGIALGSDAYDNTVIIDNKVSSNLNGFRVLSVVRTYITRNYISNNTIGIYYELGNQHEAHFNDIFDNGLAMDVSSNASVSATYNYWGHRSGPLHPQLNPNGKGNPVGGDAVNIDFIFFLSEPIDYNNAKPTAILWTDKTLVAPNQNVTFIGTDSYDDRRVDQYFFDFGDGDNSGWTTLSLFNHTYSQTGTYAATLKVIDDFSVASENVATATLTVEDLRPLSVSVTLSNEVVDCNGNVTTTVYVSNEFGAVQNANVMLFSLKGGSFSPISGLTNSTGHFETTFTAPNVTDITNVRIIARAATTGYADGSGHTYLKVLPPLGVQMTTESTTVKSEETITITVHVTGVSGQPVENALLTLASDSGILGTYAEVTNPDGNLTFNFTAPYAVDSTNATILVTATKSEYANGHSQMTIVVEPKVLAVEVIAELSATVSEAKVNVTVHVTYDNVPVQDANITMASDGGGNFSSPTALTDSNGIAAFVFTAPQASITLSTTLTAKASKTGYANGQGSFSMTVNPGTMDIEVRASASVGSGNSSVVTVYVSSNAMPLPDAHVTVSASGGNFAATTGLTDSDGLCTFVFDAPRTTVQLHVTIAVNASKNGYIDAGNQMTITVIPETTGGGWPLTTILIIVVPVVIAVAVVVVLVRSKVLVISTGEET